MNHRHDVETYVESVLDGTITAGRYVKMACERYLKDVDNAKSKGWYLAENTANAQIDFMQNLKHTKGTKWAGKPFIMSPSQKFITWNVLAFRWEETQKRRYRELYATISRKWGKSTWVAALANCLMFADSPIEVDAELYAAATKNAQAARLVTQAAAMIKTTSLKDHANIFSNRGTVSKIVLPNAPYSGSYFEPLGSDSETQDALNPHFVAKDELHAWKRNQRELNEKLDTGSGSREQPLTATITTAGSDTSILWLEYDALCCKVLESAILGECIDDTIFAFIARIDETRPCECGAQDPRCKFCDGTGDIPGDDPLDEKVWQKANPDIGVNPEWSFIRDQAKKAENSPAFLNTFTRYHTNSKVRSLAKLINPAMFAKAVDREFNDWAGCSAAWDIGTIDDLGAIGRCKEVDGIYHISSKGFCAEHGERDLERPPFKAFIEADELIVTPGEATDIREMRSHIIDWSEDCGASWCFDPANSTQLSQDIEGEGITVIAFPQTYKMYNESIRLFIRLLAEGKILHDGSELLKWAVGNACRKESNGLWMPDKEHSEDKIDPFVTVLMAFRQEALGVKDSTESVYKKRGVLAF